MGRYTFLALFVVPDLMISACGDVLTGLAGGQAPASAQQVAQLKKELI